jgi:CheY-like chemotaxis protein
VTERAATAAHSAAKREPAILILDADSEIRELVAVALSADGYRVDGCESGRDALNHLRSHPDIGVILLDLMLPRMGAARFRATRHRDRSLACIPVIAMSGAIDAARQAEPLGAHALVGKPIDLDQLRKTLRRVGGFRGRLHGDERRALR